MTENHCGSVLYIRYELSINKCHKNLPAILFDIYFSPDICEGVLSGISCMRGTSFVASRVGILSTSCIERNNEHN